MLSKSTHPELLLAIKSWKCNLGTIRSLIPAIFRQCCYACQKKWRHYWHAIENCCHSTKVYNWTFVITFRQYPLVWPNIQTSKCVNTTDKSHEIHSDKHIIWNNINFQDRQYFTLHEFASSTAATNWSNIHVYMVSVFVWKNTVNIYI